jgi:hypothetical protein
MDPYIIDGQQGVANAHLDRQLCFYIQPADGTHRRATGIAGDWACYLFLSSLFNLADPRQLSSAIKRRNSEAACVFHQMHAYRWQINLAYPLLPNPH